MGPFQRVQTKDRELNQLQSNLANALNYPLTNPLLFGAQIRDIALKTGSNTINHGLGRKLQGWILIGINAAITLYDMQLVNPSDQTLILVASGPAIANLYVF